MMNLSRAVVRSFATTAGRRSAAVPKDQIEKGYFEIRKVQEHFQKGRQARLPQGIRRGQRALPRHRRSRPRRHRWHGQAFLRAECSQEGVKSQYRTLS
uniref:RE30055p n=1 Tax=Drosophila melanogaster TaxID=7227 RepID=Q8SYW9_DROME|nr:RE30055p [Drosophila melanogaster]